MPHFQLLHRRHGAEAEKVGVDAGRRRIDEFEREGNAKSLGLGKAGHQHHGRAIIDRAGIAGGHRATLDEDRLQPLQCFHRRVRTRALIARHKTRRRLDRHDLADETAGKLA
ncbi:hypothetical protein D9M72_505480 [compost metagenome]